MTEFIDIQASPYVPNPLWDLRFLKLAYTVSEWSKDPSTKVGAAVVRPNKTVASLGFNGFARGCSDNVLFYADRERKQRRVVHGEMNALLTAAERLDGCTIYVWPPAFPPGTCSHCASAIIQAGIKRVVSVRAGLKDMSPGFEERWGASYEESFAMYTEAQVLISVYTLEEYRKAYPDG